jgi:PAS domain S-box-containing protein
MTDAKLPLHVRILQQELDERKSKNPRYSMRALARDLEVDPAALSRILSGKQDISLDTCRLIITKVQLPPVKARLFIASVAEDKKNRAQLALTRALEPRHLIENTMDRDAETIIDLGERRALKAYDSIAIERDSISVVDLEGRFLYTNEAMAKSLGRIPCELVGETWAALPWASQDADVFVGHLREAIQAKKELTFEIESRDKQRYFRHVLSPVFGADDTLTAFVSTIRDVTQNRFLLRASAKIHSSIDRDVVMSNAVRIAPPVLGEACAVRLKTAFAAYHMADDGEAYARHVERPLEHLSADSARIEILNSGLSEALSFKSHTPINAIVQPLAGHGLVVFLSARPYTDLEMRIA